VGPQEKKTPPSPKEHRVGWRGRDFPEGRGKDRSQEATHRKGMSLIDLPEKGRKVRSAWWRQELRRQAVEEKDVQGKHSPCLVVKKSRCLLSREEGVGKRLGGCFCREIAADSATRGKEGRGVLLTLKQRTISLRSAATRGDSDTPRAGEGKKRKALADHLSWGKKKRKRSNPRLPPGQGEAERGKKNRACRSHKRAGEKGVLGEVRDQNSPLLDRRGRGRTIPGERGRGVGRRKIGGRGLGLRAGKDILGFALGLGKKKNFFPKPDRSLSLEKATRRGKSSLEGCL